jgi:hypothetical protein
MKGPLVALAWAALLAVNTAVLIALGGDRLEVLLLAGASAGAALLALVLAVRRRRGMERAVPAMSLPTVLAAVAVAGLVIGAELGTWLVLISAGLLALAVAGLVREGAG